MLVEARNSAPVAFQPMRWPQKALPRLMVSEPESTTRSLAIPSKSTKKRGSAFHRGSFSQQFVWGPGTKPASKQAGKEARKSAEAREKEVRRLKHSKDAALNTTNHHEHGSLARIRQHQNIPPRSQKGPAENNIEIRSAFDQIPINQSCR